MDIKNYIKKIILPKKEYKSKIDEYSNLSYSQEGEDLVLKRIFGEQKTGFFVDIGAHHPKRFSNTYIFYLQGWRGINIDPLPGTKALFDKERPEDINIEVGISEIENELTYYAFNEPALNTFDKVEAYKKNELKHYFIKEETIIKTYPLSSILEKHLNPNQQIDFMSIDVEGLDLQVLKSNNWFKFKPRIILVEELRTSISQIIKESLTHSYLISLNYQLHYRTFNTSFYKLNT